jgi:hypothetical protein
VIKLTDIIFFIFNHRLERMLKEESISFERGVWLCIARETGIYNTWFLCDIYLKIQEKYNFLRKNFKKINPNQIKPTK